MYRVDYDAYFNSIVAMKSRVTITLDPDVHARAKQAARARRTTVSGLIESFLRSPAAAPARSGPSLVDQMLGSGELRSVPAGADPLFDALHARHIAPRPAAAASASGRRRR
jgi:Family of unknown function (DUF6364)